MQFGAIETDVLAYLCGDSWWTEHAPALLDSPKKTKGDPDVDKDNKVEVVYTAEDSKPGATLNGAPVRGRCPIPRLNAWLLAFKKVNAAIMELMDEEMVALLARMSLDDLGLNGRYFLTNQAAADWFCKFISLQMLTTVERHDTAHFDGGASILHMGLTLWGRRRLHLNLADPAERVIPNATAGPAVDEWVVTHQRPGSVYLANLCAPFHQVGHEGEDDPNDLFDAPSGKSYKVAIMFRTSCFGYARARTASNPPNPKQVFDIVSSVIHKALLRDRFRLPTLQDCLDQEEQLRS